MQKPLHTFLNHYSIIHHLKSCFTTLSLVFLFIIASTSAFSQTLNPIADAYAWNDNASTNYGSGTTIQSSYNVGNKNDRFIFMKFDISSISGTIINATPRLYGAMLTSSDIFTLYAVSNTSWGENTITYNNMPSFGSALDTIGINTTTGWWTWGNISSYIEGERLAGRTTITLAIRPPATGTNTASFNSRESATNQPELIITACNSYPTITLGSNPSVCAGTTSASLSYSATTNSPTQYSITWNAAALAAGFTNVTNATLPASAITLSVPAAVAASTYSGTLTVKTAAGCTSSGTSISVTVNASPAISQIPSANLIANYKFNGNANDESGNDNGTLQNAPASATDRFGLSNKAYSFNGSNQYVSTANIYLPPANFTISTWFKTTTTTGGLLIGFSGTQTGSSPYYDREIYMNNTGQIYFHVFNSTGNHYLNSTSTYNDGTWHHVTGSLSSTGGLKLYIDGTQIAADPSVLTAQNYIGFWKIGFNTLTGVQSVPSSFYFNGTLDDILIYHRALTATEVATIYNSPDGAGNDGPLCGNGSLTLTATTVSGATYSWTGPNGYTSSNQNPVITNALAYPGVYTVVVSSLGCTSTAYTNVVATSTSFSYTGTPYCSNTTTATVTLNGAATAGAFTASPAGLSLNASTGAINVAASTLGTYTVTNTANGVNGCVSASSASITISAPGTWTGASSTSWNDGTNWLCGVIPDNTTNVIIPSSLFNYPVITSITPEVNNLTLQSGSSITVANGTLKIKGITTTNGGIIDATGGKIEFTGTVAQTVPASLFSSNIVKDMLITNAAGVTLGGAVRITGSLGFGNVNNSVLTTGGFLTMVSISSNSANLLDITNAGVNTGNSVSGLVTVERYVQGKRAYRFLTAPVNSTSSIKVNWMENTNNTSTAVNNNPVPGYGTHITGAGGSTNGFDVTNTNNPSLFTFNTAAQTWSAVPNSNGVFTAGNGYRIMVRGSRSVDLTNNDATPSATTLRATGTLVTGTVTMAKAGAGGTAGMPVLTSVNNAYSYVANPYASAVNWLALDKIDISSTIYVFDPTVSGSNGRGAYVAYNGLLNINNVISSLINNYIQSGQGFFVQTTGLNPSLTFKETYKSTAFRPVFRTAVNELANLSVQLLLPSQVGTPETADGTRVYFSDDFSSSIGDEDSQKFTNLDENIAVLKSEKVLSIEGRKLINGSDTVQLKLWQLTQTNYTLKVGFEKFPENVEGYLEDNYLHTSTPLNSNSETLVPFSITSDAASAAADRFKIVFESLATLPVRLTNVKAYVKNKGVQVDWIAESESNMDIYEVERSADAQHFETIGSAKAANNSTVSTAYNYFDISPNAGNNYYRIKSIDKSGDVKISEVVKVLIAKTEASIKVFPNPVHGNNISIIFSNLPKASYTVTMINSTGQKVYTGNIDHTGGSTVQTIKIKGTLPVGEYQLQVIAGDTVKNIAVSVQ
ncbi:MAG: C-terminal target protein [Segetibacter sp.]|nr:C-terminal target protein [Segetibacter sp.]